MSELRFDGRVVIVTGAGGGLGRAHALLLASRGARVLVNDLGGSMHGDGKSTRAADAVVDEIKAAGGEAVANYDSVEDGDRIVQAALDAYGQLDVVINNAGILRDVSFHKLSKEDWDLVYRVHVKGAFAVTRAAWDHMRERGYGRIVMTASAAGIYGNFGQANYAMAKLGLVGFANTLAVEGKKKGVYVNTIAPIAGSRLTETVMPKEIVDALKPEYVSPLVAWLAHEDCDETGGLFEVGGGFFSKLRWERSKGELVRIGRSITPELVKARWSRITSFDGATHPTDIQTSMAPILENLQAGPSKGGNDLVDADLALGYEYPELSSVYDERDLAMYALGIGAARDPLGKDLQLVYELHNDGFVAFPTYAVIPAMKGLIGLMQQGHQVPGLNYGLDRLLHGEQYTEVLRPLPKSAKLTHRTRIKSIDDKGKGALINTEARTFDESGELLAVNEYSYFIRGAGGFGGDRGPSAEVNVPPAREPDARIEEKVGENQALLYRLSGDINPLHADPSFASLFGFERPILHGLCTFGFAARHVVQTFAKGGDARYFKSIKVRMAKSVFPGDTLVTEMWKESDTRIVFQTRVKERDEVVLSNSAVELFAELPKPRTKAAVASTVPAPKAEAAPIEASAETVFLGIKAYVAEHPELAEKIQTVYAFKLSAPESAWTVDLKNGKGLVARNAPDKADCTLEMAHADFMDMTSGKADPQKLYFGGKMKIGGNLMASQKLNFLQKIDPAWAKEAVARLLAEGGFGETAPGTGAAGTVNTEVRSASSSTTGESAAAPSIVAALGKRLAETPGLAEEVKATIAFVVREPEAYFRVALVPGSASVSEGKGPADTTLTLADADLAALCRGEVRAQTLYQHGKMRVDGDVTVAHRLGFLKGLA
jgi:3-hydroxyacyl-CoA dehydrogenase/3a,7a,12a-trihydroxy-5b-cholest-24-enoyl-CoA hydratase